MHALRSCDFCDAEAVGTFEPVPPALDPCPDERRRVLLCGDCHERLEALLEPLLARLGAEDETSAVRSETVVAMADADTERPERARSPNATVSETDAEPIVASEAREESEGESNAVETDVDPSEGTTATAEPTSLEADSESADDVEPADDRLRDSDRAVDASDVSTAVSRDDDAPTGDDRPPRAYGKVLRLLKNREFPMRRTRVEALAASAYDLESHDVGAIVEHAIDQGELLEREDELHRPSS